MPALREGRQRIRRLPGTNVEVDVLDMTCHLASESRVPTPDTRNCGGRESLGATFLTCAKRLLEPKAGARVPGDKTMRVVEGNNSESIAMRFAGGAHLIGQVETFLSERRRMLWSQASSRP